MSLRLKNPNMLPQDGFWFQEAGRVFNEMTGFYRKRTLILDFRKENTLPSATLEQVDEDLQNPTCNRHPELCYDPGNVAASSVSTYSSARVSGGCPTCGGQRA